MTRRRSMVYTTHLLVMLLAGASASFGQSEAPFLRIRPEEVKWQDQPNGLGMQTAVVEGDPAKPGYYLVMVRFPPGVMSMPHYHPSDRHAVVLKGTWYTGTGDQFTPEKTVPLKAGSYMRHPAGGHHYDGAKDEEVILAISGIGPASNVYINPNGPRYGRSTGTK